MDCPTNGDLEVGCDVAYLLVEAFVYKNVNVIVLFGLIVDSQAFNGIEASGSIYKEKADVKNVKRTSSPNKGNAINIIEADANG